MSGRSKQFDEPSSQAHEVAFVVVHCAFAAFAPINNVKNSRSFFISRAFFFRTNLVK
jgi:hypothetical protein